MDVSEGTGVVHMAPGFGEDDLELCRAEGIQTVVPVDEAGKFTAEVTDWAGGAVFDANPKIIRALKERGALVRHETIVHNYPHCWRTDDAADLPRHGLLVREGDARSASAWSS